MSDRFATLGEALNAAVEAGMRDLRTCIPAKVVKVYDSPTGQKVDCQILVKNVTRAEDDSREVNSFPVIPGVPVQFFGAGGYRLTCPVTDGGGGGSATTGLLFFSFLSLDKWLSGSGGEVDPEFDHSHALGDAVFQPGLVPFGAPWNAVPTDHMSIGSDSDGNGRIHLKSDTVELGEGATKEVARKGDHGDVGTLALVVTGTGVTIAATYTDADGTVTTVPASTSITIPNWKAKITEGSAHIKAVD